MAIAVSKVRAEHAAVHLQLCAAIGEILTECGEVHEATLKRAVSSCVNGPGFEQALLSLIRCGAVNRQYGMVSMVEGGAM